MTAQVIVLNGGSSSGKSGIARCLQAVLGGTASQQRWKHALDGLQVLWVGVRCEGTVAAGREIARGDRVTGMATSQAEVVHRGIVYDLQGGHDACRGAGMRPGHRRLRVRSTVPRLIDPPGR